MKLWREERSAWASEEAANRVKPDRIGGCGNGLDDDTDDDFLEMFLLRPYGTIRGEERGIQSSSSAFQPFT